MKNKWFDIWDIPFGVEIVCQAISESDSSLAMMIIDGWEELV